MRKKHSPHGNVGPDYKGDKSDKKRCNCCNHQNSSGAGHRVMFKDKEDPTGGWICQDCRSSVWQTFDPANEITDFNEVNGKDETDLSQYIHEKKYYGDDGPWNGLDFYDKNIEGDDTSDG